MSLSEIYEAARNLTPDQRRRWVRKAALAAALVVAAVLSLLAWIAGRVVPAESPIWEAALQGRLIAVRLVVALGLIPFGVFIATHIHNLLENTDQCRRLWTWTETDTAVVKAEKTRNSGEFLKVLVLAIVLGLLIGVLR